MKRPSWNDTFMNMAFEVARRSTCARIQVGCVLVKDKRVVSMGYNGSAPGALHCCDYFDELFETSFYKNYKSIDVFKKRDFFKGKHKIYADEHEIHAEMNAISFAAKSGISTNNALIYCTDSPCIHCAKILIQAGIKGVYYKELYTEEGLSLLKKNGKIKVKKI